MCCHSAGASNWIIPFLHLFGFATQLNANTQWNLPYLKTHHFLLSLCGICLDLQRNSNLKQNPRVSQWLVETLPWDTSLFILHALGPAHSWVHFCLSKAPFSVGFHVDSAYIQQYTLQENIGVNDHHVVFSFHSKTETPNELRVCLVKIYDWPLFQNIICTCQYAL